MKVRASILCVGGLAAILGAGELEADITPANLQAPFGVQPFAGLSVTGGVTTPFFSNLSGLPFPGPEIVDVLGDLEAFDAFGNPIATFAVMGVTVTETASTFPVPVQHFALAAPVSYTDTLNPFNQVTVDPSQFNLAFVLTVDPSFQYFYTLSVTGIPDGGFVLFNDVEGALVPEPGSWSLMALVLAGSAWGYRRVKWEGDHKKRVLN
jgi:hypothetical protein